MAKEQQLTHGLKSRLMYVENKNGEIGGANARIGWVKFSKTGRTVYNRGLELSKARGVSGNFIHQSTGHEFWVSGVKKRGSNTHWAERISVEIDADASEAYYKLRTG